MTYRNPLLYHLSMVCRRSVSVKRPRISLCSVVVSCVVCADPGSTPSEGICVEWGLFFCYFIRTNLSKYYRKSTRMAWKAHPCRLAMYSYCTTFRYCRNESSIRNSYVLNMVPLNILQIPSEVTSNILKQPKMLVPL